MSFFSFIFIFFLLAVIAIYYSVPKTKFYQNLVLFISSSIFIGFVHFYFTLVVWGFALGIYVLQKLVSYLNQRSLVSKTYSLRRFARNEFKAFVEGFCKTYPQNVKSIEQKSKQREQDPLLSNSEYLLGLTKSPQLYRKLQQQQQELKQLLALAYLEQAKQNLIHHDYEYQKYFLAADGKEVLKDTQAPGTVKRVVSHQEVIDRLTANLITKNKDAKQIVPGLILSKKYDGEGIRGNINYVQLIQVGIIDYYQQLIELMPQIDLRQTLDEDILLIDSYFVFIESVAKAINFSWDNLSKLQDNLASLQNQQGLKNYELNVRLDRYGQANFLVTQEKAVVEAVVLYLGLNESKLTKTLANQDLAGYANTGVKSSMLTAYQTLTPKQKAAEPKLIDPQASDAQTSEAATSKVASPLEKTDFASLSETQGVNLAPSAKISTKRKARHAPKRSKNNKLTIQQSATDTALSSETAESGQMRESTKSANLSNSNLVNSNLVNSNLVNSNSAPSANSLSHTNSNKPVEAVKGSESHKPQEVYGLEIYFTRLKQEQLSTTRFTTQLASLLTWWKTGTYLLPVKTPVLTAETYTQYKQQPLLANWKFLLFVVTALLPLLYFKYANFISDQFSNFLDLLGFAELGFVSYVLPVLGISYFTFNGISLLIAVKRGALRNPDLLTTLTYITYFPAIVAGPIMRATYMIPYLSQARSPGNPNEVFLFLTLGILQKWWLATVLASYFVNPVFDAPNSYNSVEILLAAYGYAFQLYLDFSGYTNLMFAIGLCFGIRHSVNFEAPYTAINVKDFWNRWHISLSSWIRDYIYIPLGGNQHGFAKAQFYTVVAMVLSGLWHGITINFLLWGLLHTLGIIVNNLTGRYTKLNIAAKSKTLARFLTFNFIVFTWIFFRADDFPTAMNFLASLFVNFFAPFAIPNAFLTLVLIAVVFFALPKLTPFTAYLQQLSLQHKTWQVVSLCVLLTWIFINFAPGGVPPFIYESF